MYSIALHLGLELMRRRGTREDHERNYEIGVVGATPDVTRSLQEMNEDAAPLSVEQSNYPWN